ncbi:type I-C CRISPR-associated endonuclease Cas1c [Desulfocurvibacter africanus]|uniref:type I-C CRISPR-associated endonuclease Cas1c n=1 Tax=Desulfocurvibacter africanus TaxID=873 RepID=UPI000482E535|nr:type I-C CRISPR-associated endonuclease Cas1c [Desulfocurvibacter africanus]
MKRLLNTLFVTTQGAYLSKDGETVAVSVDGERRLRVPVHTLDGVVCFGNVLASPFLLGMCAERDVAVSFLSENGRFLARVAGPVSGNVLLRREQFRRADNGGACLEIARAMLAGKLCNCRTVLRRSARDHPETAQAVEAAADGLGGLLRRLETTDDLEAMRGVEGDAAHRYFGAFDHMILADKEAFRFEGRNRRPPLDRMNCLLSFLYTLLAHDVRSALESVGLDCQVGFLHRDRPGRPGLALDLMEEFRPIIADRLALSLVNKRQVKASGFTVSESGAVTMDDETRKAVLVAYQERKREEIVHPFLKERVALGMLFFAQALLLARHLRGDLDGYPPFLWR